jgi:hypothetical protein
MISAFCKDMSLLSQPTGGRAQPDPGLWPIVTAMKSLRRAIGRTAISTQREYPASTFQLTELNRDFPGKGVFGALWVVRDMCKRRCRTAARLSPILITLLLWLPVLSPAAENGQGPSMLIAAAEEAAHADVLIGECRYDDAEHWIKEAARAARDARSQNALERDVAGSALGQMTIKLDEFHRQRKAWDRALADARHLLDGNHPEMAGARLDQAAAPACDQRFSAIRSEIASHNRRVTELIRLGDGQAFRYPRTAQIYYLQARVMDPDRPGLQQKLADVERRIPGACTGCTPFR